MKKFSFVLIAGLLLAASFVSCDQDPEELDVTLPGNAGGKANEKDFLAGNSYTSDGGTTESFSDDGLWTTEITVIGQAGVYRYSLNDDATKLYACIEKYPMMTDSGYELMTYSEIYDYCKKMGYPKDELKEAMAELKSLFEEVLEWNVTKNEDGTITLKSENGDASVITWTPVEA